MSNTITLSTGVPQGCVLSPQLYTLYTLDCVATHSSNSIVKFADDTVVLCLISNNDETAYMKEMEILEGWCQDNHLQLNVSKTKEMVVDYSRKQQRSYAPLFIAGAPVEKVDNFKYLGVQLTDDLTWSNHTHAQVTKARQRLYHLRQLRRFRVSTRILKTFYTAAVESILTTSIISWFGNCTKPCRE